MKLKTKNFGDIEFEESKKITFEKGIPGFRELHEYILIEDQEEDSIFAYLQSIEDGNVSFIITEPYNFDKNYRADIKEEYIEQLGGGTSEEFSIFVIITALDKLEMATLNLVAPLVIHNITRKGIQVILEHTHYKTKHRIIDLIDKRGE